VFACFDGLFVQGLPCESDDDCGPSLECDEQGYCNGRGETSVCGNWLIEANEECDDGNVHASDDCTPDCLFSKCGDGYLAPGESCDDGDQNQADECTTRCLPPSCDDGLQTADETDIDCGGGCIDALGSGRCEIGQSCIADSDCLGGLCEDLICIEVAEGVAVGISHSCILLNTGAVRCWGRGDEGQLGYGNDNQIGDDEAPASAGNVDVGGVVEQVVAGLYHTCARLNDGTVRCWGRGIGGVLGYGNTEDRGDTENSSSFLEPVDLGGTVEQLAAGANHNCAILEGGMIRCWGFAADGKLGYGNLEDIGDNETPASVETVDVGGTVIQVAAGEYHTCALLEDRTVRCWGEASLLGHPENVETIGDDEDPVELEPVMLGEPVLQISAGSSHTCAVLNSNRVRCWGYGAQGQLGYGDIETIGDDEVPAVAPTVQVGGLVEKVVTGQFHTCVVLEGGTVRCWGEGVYGQLGYGDIETIGDNETPISVEFPVDVGENVMQMASRMTHNCAILDTGGVRCWGKADEAQLGHPGDLDKIGDDETPASKDDVPCLLP
jgi:cysteine-rich repeat protein